MPGWSQSPELAPHHHAVGATGIHERRPVIAPDTARGRREPDAAGHEDHDACLRGRRSATATWQ